jgi:hypothetical protein
MPSGPGGRTSCPSDPAPVPPATFPPHTTRCPRTSVRPRRRHPDCFGSAHRRAAARPGGTPCHTTRKSGTSGTPSLWHAVSPAASQPSRELLGSSPISGCPLGEHTSGSEAPSLHRHYPASSVLRASPSSAAARSDSHESPVGRPARPPRRVSRVALAIPLPRALVLTPVESSALTSFGCSWTSAFPLRAEGRLPRLTFSGPARRSLHVRAHRLAELPKAAL